MSIHEVRIYDGEGNLKEIVEPKIDYENKNNPGWRNKKPFNRIPAEKIGVQSTDEEAK